MGLTGAHTCLCHPPPSVLAIYRYFSGIYHVFDCFGKWYGIAKSGMVFYQLSSVFDCFAVQLWLGLRAHRT